MKVAISCEKPGGGANILRSRDYRMGEPSPVHTGESTVARPWNATQGTETSQYLEEKKSTEIPRVVASERGTAQTRQSQGWRGLWDLSAPQGEQVTNPTDSGRCLERPAKEGESPVGEIGSDLCAGTPEYRGAREIPRESGETILQG